MTKQDLEKMNLIKDGITFTPQYTFSEYIYNEELEDYIYTDFTIIKTAQEVYEDNKIDICPEPTDKERITKLEEEKSILAENVYQLATILEVMLGGTTDGQTEAITTDSTN